MKKYLKLFLVLYLIAFSTPAKTITKVSWLNLKEDTPILDIRHFGVIPNQAESIHEGLNDALDELIRLGGGAIFFPPGIYYLSQTVTLPKTISYAILGPGEGLGASIRQHSSMASGSFMLDASLNSGPPKLIYGIGFNGIESPSAPKNVNGIKLSNTNGLQIENCWFRALNYGVHTPDATGISPVLSGASFIQIHKSVFESNNHAIYIQGGREGNYSGLTFYGNLIDMTLYGNSTATVINNITSFSFGIYCLRISNAIGHVNINNISAVMLVSEGGYTGAIPNVLEIISSPHVQASNISGDGYQNVSYPYSMTSVVRVSSSPFVSLSNITGKNCYYVLDLNTSRLTATNITGQNIKFYGIYLQTGGGENIFSNINIASCTHGIYHYVTPKCIFKDAIITEASSQTIKIEGVTYSSYTNILGGRAQQDFTDAIDAGLRPYSISANGQTIGYTKAIPTVILNPYNIENKFGDRARVLIPQIGSPTQWICTYPGNPGSWTAEIILH